MLAAILALTCAEAQTAPVHLKIIALNDFHGNLQSPGKMRATPQGPDATVGGLDYVAGYVEHLESENPNHIVVGAGDLIGASPLLSALFHDEPTIEAMNRMGLELTSVGNHEFDKGKVELLRKQHGGCFPNDRNTCKGAAVGTPVPFEGAKFQYLAANVIDTSTGKTLFPPYAIRTYHGIKVAFIGLTLEDTPSVVLPSGVVGLRFLNEATTINDIVHTLRPQGVHSFVVLIHQGGAQRGRGAPDINACEGNLEGQPIAGIVNHLDDSVGLVISAHSHQPYVCEIPNSAGRKIPVTSAASYGRLLTDIDVTLDPRTRAITAVTAHNLLVDQTSGIKPDPAITNLIAGYSVLAAPLINRQVGSITADFTRRQSAGGESPLGDLIADAQLDATHDPANGGAVISFMNPGGIRQELPFNSGMPGVPAGEVTFGELFTVQPFSNNMFTITLTGAQIKTVLEEQFTGCAQGFPPDHSEPPPNNRMLQISNGFSYTWNRNGPVCAKVDPASIKLNGVVIDPSATYRVAVNNLLVDGGDQFYAFRAGTDRREGVRDLDAMTGYLAKHPAVAPPPPDRITVIPSSSDNTHP